jgi:hypothetical protein
MNTALYVLHYIHSTIHYGFTFTSKAKISLHTYMSFPNRSDTEVYDDDIPPSRGCIDKNIRKNISPKLNFEVWKL